MAATNSNLYIIGAGSVGGHIVCNFKQYNSPFNLCGILDDDPAKIGQDFYGHQIIGTTAMIAELGEVAVIVGIAFPSVKRKIIQYLSHFPALHFPTLIHPNAWVSENCFIDEGSIIYPGCSINFASTIGKHVVMNLNCAIGHHAHIGDYSSLAPGVNFGGHTTIETGCDIGIGVTTIQNITVGANAVIGGQTMLIKNVVVGSKIAGVPGKNIG